MSNTHERNEQVHIVVTEDQKARWKQHLVHSGLEMTIKYLQLIDDDVKEWYRDSVPAPELLNNHLMKKVTRRHGASSLSVFVLAA